MNWKGNHTSASENETVLQMDPEATFIPVQVLQWKLPAKQMKEDNWQQTN